MRGQLASSQSVATTIEGTTGVGAMTATTITHPTILDTAKAAMIKTDPLTTTVTKAFHKLIRALNINLGDKTLRSTPRYHLEGTRTREEVTREFLTGTTTDKTWTSDTRVYKTPKTSRATTRGSKNTHAM